MLCSAPEYCYGMIDPVSQISQMAQDYGLPLHVDACFGGFILPWLEREREREREGEREGGREGEVYMPI